MQYELNEMNVSVITETLTARIEYLECRIERDQSASEWAAPELAETYETLRLVSV